MPSLTCWVGVGYCGSGATPTMPKTIRSGPEDGAHAPSSPCCSQQPSGSAFPAAAVSLSPSAWPWRASLPWGWASSMPFPGGGTRRAACGGLGSWSDIALSADIALDLDTTAENPGAQDEQPAPEPDAPREDMTPSNPHREGDATHGIRRMDVGYCGHGQPLNGSARRG